MPQRLTGNRVPPPPTSLVNPGVGFLGGCIAGGCIDSIPPSGGKKVLNIYVNSEGKLVVEYNETPVP